jgi:hypothetical protein
MFNKPALAVIVNAPMTGSPDPQRTQVLSTREAIEKQSGENRALDIDHPSRPARRPETP